MSLYNIEIFKKDFSYVSSCQVDSMTYEYDYLSLSGNKLQLPEAVTAEQGDYIRITGNSDSYLGIVEKVTDSDTFYTVTYKPFLSLFDTNMYMDREKLGSLSLEEWIGSAVRKHFEDSGDVLQDLKHVEIQLRTHTFDTALDNESNIENLYELLKTALIRYGVVVDISVDIAGGNVLVSIGKALANPRIIEADLPNIIAKEFTTKNSSKAAFNKLYVVNEKNESEVLVYYLTKAGTVKRDPSDNERLTPVLFDTVYASANEDEVFGDVAYEKAFAELSSGYENLIRLTVLKEDNLVRPDKWGIGDAANILKDGKEYTSILTGKEYNGQTVTLVFGSIRLELTKKLSRKEQKNLDTKVKNIESKMREIDTYSKTEIDNMLKNISSPGGFNIVSVPALPVSIAANTVYLIQGEVTVT